MNQYFENTEDAVMPTNLYKTLSQSRFESQYCPRPASGSLLLINNILNILGTIQLISLSFRQSEYASTCRRQHCYKAIQLTLQMSSTTWNVFGETSSVTGIIGISVGTVALNVLRERIPTAASMLEACSKDLEKIKTRFNELPADGRELIHAAVERGDCKSLETLEGNLQLYGPTNVYIFGNIQPYYLQAVRRSQ